MTIDTERAKVAYQSFRQGFGNRCPVPPWDDAPEWVRDVALVTYLQGRLDAAAPLRSALKEANEICRSAYQVAARSGKETNWPVLTTALGTLLLKQHAILSP